MAIFMDHKTIKGNCTADGFAKWVVIQHLSMGVSRAISMVTGDLANREASRCQFTELSCSMRLDASIIAMFKEATVAEQGQTCAFSFVNTGSAKLEEYKRIELENALISSYSMSCDSEDTPIMNFTISFSKITIKYKDSTAAGGDGTQKIVGFDLEKGKGM